MCRSRLPGRLSPAKALLVFSAVLLGAVISSCATIPGTVLDSWIPSGNPRWDDKLFLWRGEVRYESPPSYLVQGYLTRLSPRNKARVEKNLPPALIEEKGWDLVYALYQFMKDERNFKSYAAGGVLIAKRTVDEIFEDGTLSGCHDWGIVLASMLRTFGIPAVYVDAVSVPWAVKRVSGRSNLVFEGHIFIEAWMEGRWVLLNSIAPEVILDYDRQDGLIDFPVAASDRFYIMFKGLDPIDFGVRSREDLKAAMLRSAEAAAASSRSPRTSAPVVSIRRLLTWPERGIQWEKVNIQYL